MKITQSKTELPEYNSLEIYEEYRRYLAIQLARKANCFFFLNLSYILATYTFASIIWDELFNFHKDQKIKSKITKQRISIELVN